MKLPNLRRQLPLRVRWTGKRLYRLSYAQEGEDLLLDRIFDGKKRGFYVDIGAHHPKRFSNTFIFYKRGWSGINIDPLPGAVELFRKKRPRDRSFPYAVAKTKSVRDYFILQDSACSTFDEASARRLDRTASCEIVKVVPIETLPLHEILDRHLPPGQTIDFMTIDVEGLDEDVVLSNNWELYRPAVLLIEMRSISLDRLSTSPITRLLRANEYEMHAKLHNTVCFVDARFR